MALYNKVRELKLFSLETLQQIKKVAETALANCIERDKKTRSKGGGITFNAGTGVRICDVSYMLSVDGNESIQIDICKANCGQLCLAVYNEIIENYQPRPKLAINVRSEW